MYKHIRQPLQKETGSLTLETAVTVPLFFCFCLLLAWIVMVAKTEALLRDAVDEAVKSTAAHAYPLDLIARVYENHPHIQELEQRLERFLPYSVRALLDGRRQKALPPLEDSQTVKWVEPGFHRTWAAPLVMEFVDEDQQGRPQLERERLTIERIALPTFLREEGSYFGLVVSYRVPIPIPFLQKQWILSASAIERCWVGDK
jgi:hypothetical protein